METVEAEMAHELSGVVSTPCSLAHHMTESIQINSKRSRYYLERSKGISSKITSRLLFLERVTKVFAWFFDWWSKTFHRQGIPIIRGDVVSMRRIRPKETRPKYQNKATPEVLEKVKDVVSKYKRTFNEHLNHRDYEGIAHASKKTLGEVRAIEKKGKCHFAMLAHMIESVGFTALHFADYAKKSDNKTANLSSIYLRFHALGIDQAIPLDLEAQKAHKLGVGIIVNDVPNIPFEQELAASMSLRQSPH